MKLSLTLFSIGVCCYAMHELCMHGKIRFKSHYWQLASWKNKWKWSSWLPYDAPDNWYYRFFKLEYKERFPGSATIFVAFTDAPHMLQFFYSKLFILAIVLYSETYSWWVDGLVYLGVWYLVWNVTYKMLSK